MANFAQTSQLITRLVHLAETLADTIPAGVSSDEISRSLRLTAREAANEGRFSDAMSLANSAACFCDSNAERGTLAKTIKEISRRMMPAAKQLPDDTLVVAMHALINAGDIEYYNRSPVRDSVRHFQQYADLLVGSGKGHLAEDALRYASNSVSPKFRKVGEARLVQIRSEPGGAS